jgi:calcium-dependent protein kinase
MGCAQSSAPEDGTPGENPVGLSPDSNKRQYVSQKSAQSTLNTKTTRKSVRRTSLTGWTIKSIEEYYEPIAKNGRRMEIFGKNCELGTGNFGTVYKARNIQKNYECALKKILCAKSHNSNSMDSLRKEVNILKQMHHPGIIRIYEIMETNTHLYISQEMCTGGELFDAVVQAGNGAFSEKDAAAIMRMALEALDHCHQHQVVHRDLKPENFLLASPLSKSRNAGDPFPQIKMIDFGLADHHKFGKHFQLRAGTPYYMAPEILAKNYDLECDCWSMGVVMYILLCGYPPFYGDDDEEIYGRIRKGLPKRFGDEVESWLKSSSTKNAKARKPPGTGPNWAEYDDFFPKDEWNQISSGAIDMIRKFLVLDPKQRLSAKEGLKHPWILSVGPPKPEPLNRALFERLRKFTGHDKFKRIAKRMIAETLPDKDIATLLEAFKAADTDRNGVLTSDELRVVLHAHISKSTEKSAEELDEDFATLINTLDIDGDGEIGYAEFIAGTMEIKHWATAERMEKAFHALDRDNSQALELAEIKIALGVDDATSHDILERFDKNHDGKIDMEEFKQMMLENEQNSRKILNKKFTKTMKS